MLGDPAALEEVRSKSPVGREIAEWDRAAADDTGPGRFAPVILSSLFKSKSNCQLRLHVVVLPSMLVGPPQERLHAHRVPTKLFGRALAEGAIHGAGQEFAPAVGSH